MTLVVAFVIVMLYVVVFGSPAAAGNTPFWLPIDLALDVTWDSANSESRPWLAFLLGWLLVWIALLLITAALEFAL